MDFRQVFLGELLNGPSDDQATLVGFLGFGDDMEVDMRNDLWDHSSIMITNAKGTVTFHLVSDLSVILTDLGASAGHDTESGEGELAPVGCCSFQDRTRRRSSLQRSENPRDTHPERRGASRHALSMMKRRYGEQSYDANDRYTTYTWGSQENDRVREGQYPRRKSLCGA